jgi:PAS domain
LPGAHGFAFNTAALSLSSCASNVRSAFVLQVCILNYKKTGQKFWNQFYLAPIFGEEGEVLHYVGIQTDVSAQISAAHPQAALALADGEDGPTDRQTEDT